MTSRGTIRKVLTNDLNRGVLLQTPTPKGAIYKWEPSKKQGTRRRKGKRK